jgi:two-component system, chemotaxis family, protein-glutamate methylesterase/glutaminase
MPNRDVVAIGTSAGGVEALRFLAREFPADFPAAVLVVIHLSPHFHSSLDAILTQDGPLPACFASDGMPLERGRIYIGPPDAHLLADGDRLSLGLGPRENNARPAIDPLFRSLALCCGPRAIGAVLTGTLGDGASGLHSLHEYGGITVVQDPGDAAFAGMPEAALSEFTPDHVASLASMPALFGNLVAKPVGEAMAPTFELRYEVDIARGKRGSMADLDRYGRRSVLACPDCHGVMWEIKEGDLVRYRCHVGHAYTAELMSLALDENLQRALGSGLRALDERIALAKSLQREAKRNGHNRVADSWRKKLSEYEREAQILRDSMRRVDEIAARAAQAAE